MRSKRDSYLNQGSLSWISMMEAVTWMVTGKQPRLRHADIWNWRRVAAYITWCERERKRVSERRNKLVTLLRAAVTEGRELEKRASLTKIHSFQFNQGTNLGAVDDFVSSSSSFNPNNRDSIANAIQFELSWADREGTAKFRGRIPELGLIIQANPGISWCF